MPDLARFLLGGWDLTRVGRDDLTGLVMRLHGSAEVRADPHGLLFDERGVFRTGAHAGEATQQYRLHPLADGTAEVCFTSGAPFHHLDLRNGAACVHHDCAPDRYDGRYRVLGQGCWLLAWRVTGPRKRTLITSRFTRMPERSPGRQH